MNAFLHTPRLSRGTELSYARWLMATWSPTLEGFRAVFRRPSLSFAEVIWRWSFGAATTVLLAFGLLAYLDTLPVSNADQWMLRSAQPLFLSQALAHVFHGTALRVIVAGVILVSATSVLWILLGSIGRAATLSGLLDYIRRRAQLVATSNTVALAAASPADVSPNSLRALAGLRFLRVALALAAGAAAVGAVVMSSHVSTRTDPHPGLALFLITAGTFLIWTVWSSISWFLSTASIFVVRQGHDTFGAVLATVELFCRHTSAIVAVGTWFGTVHLVLFFIATSVVSFPLAFVGVIPPIVVIGAVLSLTLAYFAVVDALRIGRFAGYLAILEAPPAPPPVPPPPPIPDALHAMLSTRPETAMVDQDEPILSDSSALLEAQGSPSLPLSVTTATEVNPEPHSDISHGNTLETTPNETATQSKLTTDD